MFFFVNLSKTLCILFTCQPDQTQSSSYILGVDIGTTSVKVFDDSRKKKDVRHCFMIFGMFCNVQEQCTTVALFKGLGVFQQGRECNKHVLLDLVGLLTLHLQVCLLDSETQDMLSCFAEVTAS